jgi:mannose/cellobiose epimerase-like protein (N-acyl-D-glucosamine 2-epimerase family)
LTALGLAAGSTAGCERRTIESGAPNARQETRQERITTLGGLSLEQLRDKYRTELFTAFIPNMDRYAVDHKHGGVMCSLDVRSGKLLSTNKSAWFVGRGLWLYSFLYNNLERKPHYLEIARKATELLLSMQPTDGSFWPRDFNREGTSLSAPGDIYGSLFIAEGLAEYASASGERQYRQMAKKIIVDCLTRYDRPDYAYQIGHLKNPPRVQGPRVLGHWMVLLSLCTQMLRHEPDGDLEQLAARSVDAILKHHVNAEYGLANEILNHDFSLPDNEYAQFAVVGHGIEALAFVMFEAERRRDAQLFGAAKTVFKKHVDVATDALYGGYLSLLLNVDDYKWGLWKSLWCQQEVLNGCLFLIEHAGDEWATQHFTRAHTFIFAKYFKPSYKFWLWGGDRKMVNPDPTLLEHYHHARQLMLGLLSLERMVGREGAVSGLFA